MAKWVLQVASYSPGAGVADSTTIGTSGFIALQGGSSTQYIKVQEIEENGQAPASAANYMLWARSSTVMNTATALATPNSLGPMDPNSAALASAAVGAVAATSGSFRAGGATIAKLNLSFNAFGGILRWQAAPGEEWGQLGNTATSGETTLSTFTGSGTGLMGAHIVMEIL